MSVFMSKPFNKWAISEKVSIDDLHHAVIEITQGLIDAELGGGIIKKRVRVANRGKSAGARTILAYKNGAHTFFIFGFLKNQTDNITSQELKALKKMAKELFSYDQTNIKKLITSGQLIEIKL
ncbi:MAG: type II toxin-antitoxin system RelE/ParE family toxin [Enterovibrio sp.]